MIAVLYPVVAMVILLLQLLLRTHRSLSLLGVIHPVISLIITLYFIVSPGIWDDSPFFLIDHMSLFVMLTTSIIFAAAALYAVGYIDGLVRSGDLEKRSLRIFYFGFSFLLAATTMAIFTPNIALFWICAELTTVLSAVLIAILALKATIDASLKYIFICSTSMLFSFIGIIFLFEAVRNKTGVGSLLWTEIVDEAAGLDSGMVFIAFVFFFIGFAAKSGIVPFHTWLPLAHAKAPSAVSAVLSGAILNIGMYGILRMTGIMKETGVFGQVSVLLIVFAMITISVACLSMLRQKKLKTLIAFSSIENMGFILLGIGIGSPVALFWALFHMLSHSCIKAGLFFSAGILHRQYKVPTRTGEDEIGDLLLLQPFAAVTVMAGCAALIGMPLFPLFLSKVGILLAAAAISVWIPAIVLLLFACAGVALLRFYLPVMAVRFPAGEGPVPYTAPLSMKVPIVLLLLLSIMIGTVMIPGEEAFLAAAVADLGFGVQL
ncbi:NADH dehydrogenase (quinone) [Methanospirillum hungatei JF-1]|uniref:NADH dehydrogenase (Quinone) n=1 Tax=Methanospirillum hungatei JF-1 (strain ATCC 27890 / DSM 864 / NBRC 100397 / JF-1) TaxID=323259 RepID=Q2FKT2_METHJ|nr:proton-conducting transporter membrane subunit [Methanospirillum hungatei]ABD41539.1 NADH dehydrogenase (quinone) [Methanospirillum hungatei JF-1]